MKECVGSAVPHAATGPMETDPGRVLVLLVLSRRHCHVITSTAVVGLQCGALCVISLLVAVDWFGDEFGLRESRSRKLAMGNLLLSVSVLDILRTFTLQ